MRLYTFFAILTACYSTAMAQNVSDTTAAVPEIEGITVPSKTLSDEPPFKRVFINGRPVVTKSEKKTGKAPITTLPAELRTPGAQEALKTRKDIQAYAHTPVEKMGSGKLVYTEMTDLSCLQCMQLLVDADGAMASYTEHLHRVHISLPIDAYSGTNLAAYYGKVAQQFGKFWEYRAIIINIENPNADSYTQALLDIGLEPRDIRKAILKNSRRYYRELDADVVLARRLGQEKPPAQFINGTPIGGAWLPFDTLGVFLDYELQRQVN